MKNIIIIVLAFVTVNVFAQTNLVIADGHLVNGSNSIVLKNTKLTNNGTFHAGSGEVIITGDGIDANSEVGGTSLTTFYNLTINKSANHAILGNDINISNLLTLTNGNIDLDNYNLTINNTGNISGGSAISYVKTSNSGVLTQEVGASNIIFPIGNQSYTPVTLNNNGTTDNFNARVENAVYENGTSGNTITTDVVNATWHISETTAGGSDITATFQWNGSDELTNFERSQSFISNYENDQWNNGTSQTASGSNPYTLTQSGITNLSSFIVASDATALPVELLYFYGEQIEEGVQLDWQTVTEINNSHFDVEWSTDGFIFEKIGEVAGAGNTNEVQFYEFLHEKPVTGKNYYRLRQVDFDGQYEYTNIISITIEQTNNTDDYHINVYPNPASHYLNVESENSIGEVIYIFNANGQVVKEFQHQSLITNVSIIDLPSGTYFVKAGQTVRKVVIINPK